MEKIKALLESEDVQVFIKDNNIIFENLAVSARDFAKILKETVLQNPMDFISENVESTYKNIRTFSEAATEQFLTESVAMLSSQMTDEIYVHESVVDEYL